MKTAFLLLMLISPLINAESIPTLIPGIFQASYQGEQAYHDDKKQGLLIATLIDMGGEGIGLGQDLAIAQVKKNIGTKLNGILPDAVSKTSLHGIYELSYGKQVVYVDGSGRFIFKAAKLISSTGKDLNTEALTRAKALQAKNNLKILTTLTDNEKLLYSAANEQSRVIVFTDIDCIFCQRIHQELGQYQHQGVSVEYIFFPQEGINSEAYRTFTKVWCASDPYAALEKAERGQIISGGSCHDHPVDKHLAVARKLRLTATPVIALGDGTLVYGYQTPEKIISLSRLHRGSGNMH